MSVFQKTLKNKTVLIAEPIAQAKTVAIGFWFSTGSRYEKDGEHGISHFVEHMLFKGTKTKSSYDIACAFDYIGSYVNAFTDREAVCMHCTVPKNKVAYALEYFCDMTENSLFASEEVERERNVIESEIISSRDDPEEAASDAVMQALWPDQALSASIAGDTDDVKNLTRDQLYEWYLKYIVHGKLTVCIAGNCDIEEVTKVLESLSEHTEQKIQEGLFDSVFSFPLWKSGKSMIKAPFLQEQIFLLYPLKPVKNNHQMLVQNIFNAIVGDTMSSRLFQRLREAGGYSYNVYSYFNMFSDCGYWCAYASASKEKTFCVIKEMQEELQKLLASGISESELEGAKQHLCGEEIIAGEDMENHVKRLIRSYVNKTDYLDTEKLISDIMSVTKEEVSSFIEELLNNKNFALILYGPKKSKMELDKI